MSLSRFAVVMLPVLMLVSASAMAEDAAAAAAPTTRPAPDAVVATVGAEKILIKDVDQMFIRRVGQLAMRMRGQSLSPEQLAGEWKRTRGQMINAKLVAAYLKDADCPAAALAAKKQEMGAEAKRRYDLSADRYIAALGMSEDELRDEVKLESLMKSAATPEKIQAAIKADPSHFDGTTVQASHILISCDPNDPEDVLNAARKKLTELADQIRSGKIKFAEAAMQNSSCPSKARGGDLGPFTFERMVVPFSQAAFSMKADQISGVVQSPFGLHLIQVTKRTEGTGKAGERAAAAAENLLKYQLQQKILAEARKANPVTVVQ